MFEKSYYDMCAIVGDECSGVCQEKYMEYKGQKCPAHYLLNRRQMVEKKLGKKITQKQLDKILGKYEGDSKED